MQYESENPVQQAILARYSTRGFSPETLSEAALSALEDAALAAPTAMNRQELRFSFILSEQLRREIHLAFFRDGLSDMMRQRFEETGKEDLFYGAPLLVLISSRDEKWAEVDAGIAVQNLALAAEGLGLGSCIIGCIDKVLREEGETAANLRKKLGIEEGETFRIAIAIGRSQKAKAPHQGKAEQIRRIGAEA